MLALRLASSRASLNLLRYPRFGSPQFHSHIQHQHSFTGVRFSPSRFSYTTSQNLSPGYPPARHTLPLSWWRSIAISCVLAGAYYTSENAHHAMDAVVRCSRAGWVAIVSAADYKYSLRSSLNLEDDAAEKVKSAVNKRSAERTLKALQRNGGIYIKLGQHISALVYLLPEEWTSTMAPLQDRCPPTDIEGVRNLFRTDMGVELEDIFDEFDEHPIGVASLAQVHRAVLKQTGQTVAVKIQHPNLDEYSQIDIETVSFIMKWIKRIFPEFEFEWLAKEMAESLPKELDFRLEAANAQKVRENFKNVTGTSLKIPDMMWAERRILIMEHINGGRIDNLAYLQQNHISPNDVSSDLTKIFSEMIYIHGWVHCDPHPGNILIRPHVPTRKNPHSFEIVLLDHGLYRALPHELRLDYARLWTALIAGDEPGIREYSYRVGGTDTYRLFASLLTGRAWDAVAQSKLDQSRSLEETKMVKAFVGQFDFLMEVADLLSKIPRVVLLLFKTNDLLRSVDSQLRTTLGENATYVIMGRYCARAVYEDGINVLMNRVKKFGITLDVVRDLVMCWWEYRSMDWSLWIYQVWSGVKVKFERAQGKDKIELRYL